MLRFNHWLQRRRISSVNFFGGWGGGFSLVFFNVKLLTRHLTSIKVVCVCVLFTIVEWPFNIYKLLWRKKGSCVHNFQVTCT